MKRTLTYNIGKIVQRIIRLFMPFKVNNIENMPEKGKIIVCCNHVSLTDPLRLAFSQNRQIYFMAKAELFKNKVLGMLLTSLGAFPVQRGRGDKTAINKAQELLNNGKALGIFIEGTRSKTGELLQPKAGAVMIAYNYNTPILPCCITAKDGGVPKMFHRVILSYGELIYPNELGIENGAPREFRNASRIVMSKITELRERDLKANKK